MITFLMIRKMMNPLNKANFFKVKQGGFTLIEILIAIAIVSVLMSIATINIPNHDFRNLKNDTNHLVNLINLAHEESLINGRPLQLRIDQNGWKFFYLDANGFNLTHDQLTVGARGMNESLLSNKVSNKLPDIYKAQLWSKPISISPVEITLGEELLSEEIVIKITQDTKRVSINRNRYGYFEVINE